MTSDFGAAACRAVPRDPHDTERFPLQHSSHNAGVAGSSPAPAIHSTLALASSYTPAGATGAGIRERSAPTSVPRAFSVAGPAMACDVCGCTCEPRLPAAEAPREDDVVRTALWRAALGFTLTYRDRWVMDSLLRFADTQVPRSQPAQMDLFAPGRLQ
jgi:hypothetical protein